MSEGVPARVPATAPVGVVGAGTMGAGIAQVAAVAGRRVLLADAVAGTAERAVGKIRERVKAQVAKGRLSIDPDSLQITATSVAEFGPCAVVAEAVVEDLAVKRRLLADLEEIVAPDAILASNSSSLSPTAMAAGLRHPERVVGLHFFNPVPAMKLVEVISGLATSPAAADAAAELAVAWGKTVVRSTATPAFIVNRIARPYYAEAWRLVEEHATPAENVDAVLTGAGGFRMGPFALMDLVGHDVNEAVTRSVWSAFGCDPRFTPSLGQRALVEAGRFGRKTGQGVYSYADGVPPPAGRPAAPAGAVPGSVTEHGTSPLRPLLARSGVPITTGERDDTAAGLPGGLAELPLGGFLAQCAGPTATSLAAALERPVVVVDRALNFQTASAIAIAASDGCPPGVLDEATGLLQSAGLDVYVIDDVPGLIVTRTVAMLVNLAADALGCRVASADDIDTAMRLGVSYPLGPLAWGARWGVRQVLSVLDSLENWYRDGHYRAAPLLRRWALSERTLPGQALPRQ
jgi:3-hydroxybutyryl-CoA dehydrogenase